MRNTTKLHEIEDVLYSHGWQPARRGNHDIWKRGNQTIPIAHHGGRSKLKLDQLRQQLRRLDAERDAAS